jgi:uncharacterized protein
MTQFQTGPISYLLVKVAARCNIDCSYCYWFSDDSVYAKPKLMGPAVRGQLLSRVEAHIVEHPFSRFSMLLHGGEPLLWGVKTYRTFAQACRAITQRTGCPIDLATTTNGVLIDEPWLDLFEEYEVSVTVSIDGPARIHDIHRRTFQGGPTHAAAERGLRLLQSRKIHHGVLAVCNPAYPAKEFFDYFVTHLGLDGFDILIPDATCDDTPASIATFYCDLFDLWLQANQVKKTVRVRLIEDMAVGLLGGESTCEGIGYAPTEVCTIHTDGGMEPLDVLRIAGHGSTATSLNIFKNTIEDIKHEPRWLAARAASLKLCDKCERCKFRAACGGGYLPHRFSRQNGYDNPSAYCDDLYATFGYMQAGLEKHLHVGKPAGSRGNFRDAVAASAGTS